MSGAAVKIGILAGIGLLTFQGSSGPDTGFPAAPIGVRPDAVLTGSVGPTFAGIRKIPADTSADEWRRYGRENGGTRFSPLAQVTRKNVGRLTRVWTYHTGEFGGAFAAGPAEGTPGFQSTPLIIDGVLYVSTASSRVIALDADTGRELWRFDPQSDRPIREYRAHRGVSYWEGQRTDGTLDRRILVGTWNGRLFALDAKSGHPVRSFGDRGSVDLRVGVADRFQEAEYAVTSPPAIFRDLVIVGAQVPDEVPRGPSGDLRAFDVRSGREVWRFHTIPRDGEPGAETWARNSRQDRTGVNAWSIISVDEARGIVFLPLGSASYDFYGGDRVGQNLYANSLVALDATTGRRLWHFQLVHHDIWDYDPPAQPILLDLVRAGRPTPAVVQLTKMGLVFVFDRTTGKPVFPIEERRVPSSTVEGERTWPTQPFPVLPAPLSRHRAVTGTELSSYSSDSRRECAKLFERLVSVGLYAPPRPQLTVWFPGNLGGATWSGGAVDPQTGMLFVNTNEVGAIGGISKATSLGMSRRESPWGEYARFWDSERRPCQQPPWGLLHAIDLRTGALKWRIRLGGPPDPATGGREPTGALNLGGPIVTAGGLVFIGATTDRRFRAIDTDSGHELWSHKLEAAAHATPVTYRTKSGRQLVVIAAGGGGKFSRTVSDVVAAFGLPE